MRRRTAIRILRTSALCVVLVAAWYGLSYKRDWFCFYGRQDNVVRDVQALGASLRATGLAMNELGRVQYGPTALPIWVLRREADAGPAGQAAKPATACLLGGVHGNEPAGTQALLELAQDLGKPGVPLTQHRLVLVPLVNPWGWARDLRHNGDNRDAARQFVDGQAQEAALVKQLLAQEKCTLLVDLHEDRFHDGFYLLAYAPAPSALLDGLVQRITKQSGVAAAGHVPQGMYRVPQAGFAGIRLTTASLWGRIKGVPHSFIVETPDSLAMERRVAVHRAAINGLLDLLR